MKRTITALLIFLCSFAQAATYYVSPTGNDATGDGSQAKPWKTMAKATASVSTPGDTIHLLTGTYTESTASFLKLGVTLEGDSKIAVIVNSTVTGTWNTLLTLESPDNSNGAQEVRNITFNGGYISETNMKTWVAIWVTGRSNVKIHDCNFNNFKQSCIIFNGNGSTTNPGKDAGMPKATGNSIYNCVILNCSAMYQTTGQGCVMFGFQKAFEIHDCTIKQDQRPNFLNGWPIKYWNQGFNDGGKIYNNILTKRPYAGTYPGENSDWDFCIELFSNDGLEIYGNTIQGSIDLNYNFDRKGYGYCTWIHDNTIGPAVQNTKVEGGIILEFRTENVKIENNIFRNLTSGISYNTRGVGNRGGDRNNTTGDNIPSGYSFIPNTLIRNNLMYNMYNGSGMGNRFGIGIISDGPDDPQFSNFQVLNNTIIAKAGDPSYIGIDLTSMPSGNGQNLIISNNIIQGFNTAIRGSSPTNINGCTLTNNDLYLNGSGNIPVWPGGNPAGYVNTGNVAVNPQLDATYNSALPGIGYRSGNTPPPSPCTYVYGPWGPCDPLTSTQTRVVTGTSPAGCVQNPPPVLTQSCTPAPVPCTYTYSAWSACDATGMQYRTVTASPAGCVGTPGPLSQACTPPPPVKILLFAVTTYNPDGTVKSIVKYYSDGSSQ